MLRGNVREFFQEKINMIAQLLHQIWRIIEYSSKNSVSLPLIMFYSISKGSMDIVDFSIVAALNAFPFGAVYEER